MNVSIFLVVEFLRYLVLLHDVGKAMFLLLEVGLMVNLVES